MNFIRKYLYLIILSATLVLGAVGVSLVADIPLPQRFSEEVAWPEFLVESPDGTYAERVTIYDAGDGNCYVFLPSYAAFERMTVTAGKGQTFALDGAELSETFNCGNFQLETPYAFTADGVHLGNLWLRRSENVAAVYVDTVSGSMEGILHDTYPEELANARVYTAEGKLDHLEDYGAIKCRGYSSWAGNKKSYTLSLGKSTGLLGMGNSEKWTLTANAYDPTRIRNRIVYSFAEQIAPYDWAPECSFTELYLNGEYAGLYLLCQKPDTGPDHMNLPAEDYYFEIIPTTRGESGPMMFDFCASETAEVIFPQKATEDQVASLQSRLEQIHEAIVSEEDTPWQEYIDMNSFVRKYLLEEVFRNGDGGRASTFFHYDTSEEKLYVGHCWDYDGTFGALGKGVWTSPYSMLVIRDWCEGPSWFGSLYQKESFKTAFTELYEKEYRPLLLEYKEETIPEIVQEIRGVIESEYLRWPEYHTGTDWEPAIDGILDFLNKRIAFLDALWLEGKQFYEIDAEESNLYVAAGTVCEDLPENIMDPEGIWYLAGTDIPFDASQPITGDVKISALPESKIPPPTEEAEETAPAGGFATQDYIAFLSIGALGMLLLLFACVDFFLRRKDRRNSHGRSRSKVSS